VVAALYGQLGDPTRVVAELRQRLGKRCTCVASLGTFPWPHYKLELGLEARGGAVLLRVASAQVTRTHERALPGLAHVLRDVLNALPAGAEAWLHAGTFDTGLSARPAGGWALQRGSERRPQLCALELAPDVVEERVPTGTSSLGLGKPDAALLAARDGVHDAVPGVAG
jgi:hypothetical protein